MKVKAIIFLSALIILILVIDNLEKIDSKNSEIAFKERMSNKTRIYSFESMDDFIDASKVINHIYNDPSYLYKKSGSDRYYLIMQRCCCPWARCGPGPRTISRCLTPCHRAIRSGPSPKAPRCGPMSGT